MSPYVNNFTADNGEIIAFTAMFVITCRVLYCNTIRVFLKGVIMQCKVLE